MVGLKQLNYTELERVRRKKILMQSCKETIFYVCGVERISICISYQISHQACHVDSSNSLCWVDQADVGVPSISASSNIHSTLCKIK